MAKSWYYSTNQKREIIGPCSEDELRRRAQSGLLGPHDLIWPAGSDPLLAIAAESALTFPLAKAVAPAGVPDWLADVEAVETHIGPQKQDWPAAGLPDWVADLRRLEGLAPVTHLAPELPEPAHYPPPVQVDWTNALAIPAALIPDGMALTPPAPAPPPSPAAGPPNPSSNPALTLVPGGLAESPLPSLPQVKSPPSPAVPIDAPPPAQPPKLQPLVADSPTAPPAPTAATASDSGTAQRTLPMFRFSAPPRSAAPPPISPPVSPLPRSPEKPPAPAPVFEYRGESLQELYQRAQSALQQWADLDINRPLILSGDLDAVRSDIAIKSILDLLDKYGPAITDRFWHHVEFVLENRKKYFEAVSRGR